MFNSYELQNEQISDTTINKLSMIGKINTENNTEIELNTLMGVVIASESISIVEVEDYLHGKIIYQGRAADMYKCEYDFTLYVVDALTCKNNRIVIEVRKNNTQIRK